MKRNLLLSPDGGEGSAGAGTAAAGAGGEGGAGSSAGSQDILDDAEHAGDGAARAGDEGDKGGEGAAGTGAGEGKTGLSITKDDIAEILKSAGLGAKSSEVAAEVKKDPPSQEELEKMFNVWKPTNELIAQLRSDKPEEAIKAVLAMRDGMLKQAMTMAEYRVQQLLEKIQTEQISPISEYVSEQQATSFRNDFFKDNPDLEKYETLVDAVAAKLQASGYKGANRSDVMKKFAEETRAVVKTLLADGGNGNGAAAASQNGNAGQPSASRKMSTLTGGGHGGGGGKTGVGAAKGPPGLEVFD